MEATILKSESQRSPLDFESASEAELEVFGLIPALIPALNAAYCRYMRMADNLSCSDGAEERQKATDKAAFRSTIEEHGERHPANSANLCALFANRFCDLPFDQAYLWHRRVEAQEWRQGLRIVHGVTVSDQYRALQDDETNKLTTAALFRKDGSVTWIDADDAPF